MEVILRIEFAQIAGAQPAIDDMFQRCSGSLR
jgi:hypothetical protein